MSCYLLLGPCSRCSCTCNHNRPLVVLSLARCVPPFTQTLLQLLRHPIGGLRPVVLHLGRLSSPSSPSPHRPLRHLFTPAVCLPLTLLIPDPWRRLLAVPAVLQHPDGVRSPLEEKKEELNHMFGMHKWKSHVTQRPLEERSAVVKELYKPPTKFRPLSRGGTCVAHWARLCHGFTFSSLSSHPPSSSITHTYAPHCVFLPSRLMFYILNDPNLPSNWYAHVTLPPFPPPATACAGPGYCINCTTALALTHSPRFPRSKHHLCGQRVVCPAVWLVGGCRVLRLWDHHVPLHRGPGEITRPR